MARQKRTQTLCCVFLLVATIIVLENEAKGNLLRLKVIPSQNQRRVSGIKGCYYRRRTR